MASETPQIASNKSNSLFFVAALVVLSLLKFWLISGEEILASAEGYDMAWHILAAMRNVWFGGAYDHVTFIHLPVSPLWISLVHSLGIPLRAAVEVAFLASGLYFVYALRKTGVSRFISLACFVLTIFNPWTFRLFNLTLAEIPYTFLLLAAVSAALLVLAHRNDSRCLFHSVLLGVWCALLWNLRKESMLIGLLLLLLSLVCMLLMRKQGISWGDTLRKQKTILLVPLLSVALVTTTFLALNYGTWGLFAMTELSSTGYTAAYKALLRIRPKQQVHYVSITSQARQAAYAVSPAFRKLRFQLESPHNRFARETERVLDIRNEIASGWFYWALRDAAAASGHLMSARQGNAFFQQIADEINRAINEGRLEGRFTPFTFLDPDVFSYSTHIPGSFLKIGSLFRERQELQAMIDDAPPELAQVYDTIAMRRQTAVPNRFAENLQHLIWNVHGLIIDSLMLLGAIAAVTLVVCRTVVKWQAPLFVALLLIGYVVFSRTGLFALLDASSWPANQPRYVLPVMPLFSSFLVLLLNQAWIAGRQLFSRTSNQTGNSANG